MIELSTTLWEKDLVRIRDTCLGGMTAGRNLFELTIIPTTGLTEDSLPIGFAAAVRKFCELSDSAPIIPQRLHLLPYFSGRSTKPTAGKTLKPFNGISGWVNVDKPQPYRITAKVDGEEEAFVAVLRTFSRRDNDGELLPGESKYLEFMRFAGGLLRYHKNIATGDDDHAWISFLLGYLWNHNRPKVSHLFATVGNLWGHSLAALDQLNLEIQQKTIKPKRTRGANIHERMIATLADNPDSFGWSVRKWAEFLGCSTAAVHKTKCWQERLKEYRLVRPLARKRLQG